MPLSAVYEGPFLLILRTKYDLTCLIEYCKLNI